MKRARLPVVGDTRKEVHEYCFYRPKYVMSIFCSCALGGRFVRLQYGTVRSTMEKTLKRGKMRAI